VSKPLRHYFIPSKVHWTDEGHRFAWHMKLRDKRAEAAFFAADPATGRRWRIDPRDYVTSRQALKMATRPDMMVQFARHVAADHRRRGKGEVQVRARVHASLNGRPPQPLVDPTVDLAAQERLMGAAPWVLPLKAPLRPSKESTTSVK
jgi:vitamin K-dependent gamma-carboxylase